MFEFVDILKVCYHRFYFFSPAFTRDFENDIAFIMCSSGSTGLSKAICLSQGNALASPKMPLGGSSLSFSSLYWMSGLIGAVAGTVSGASRVITRQPFTAEWFFDIVEKYKVALFLGSPTHFAQILKSPRLTTANLSSLTMVVSVGSAMPEHYKTEIEKYVQCGVSYGMTELGSVGCGTIVKYKPGSVGTPMTNLSLRVSFYHLAFH
jgi:4-coumarate--CoA ligase